MPESPIVFSAFHCVCSSSSASKIFGGWVGGAIDSAKEGCKMDLIGLVKELERQKANSLDLIVDSQNLWAIPDEEEGVRLGIPDRGQWYLTEWAHLQLAEKLGIPKKYYDRMREAGKIELLADNINTWLQGKERRLLRILDGRIRAILSDRYRIIDNYDLVFLALDEFKKKETVEVYRIDLTETMLYLKAVDRTLTASIKEEDIVYGGLILRNSEVGASALRVEPFILRRACSNGLILQHSLKKIHLGRQTLEIGYIDWSDETRELEDRALWSKVRDIIRATFDREVFESWVAKLKESTEIKIEKPIEAVNNIVKHLGLNEEQKSQLLMHFSEHTKYGLINAVTNLASETKNVEAQIKLEEFAGKILETPLKNFESLFA
jgi:hypothetical protein